MAKGYIVDKAIEDAAFILERIDKRWPRRPRDASWLAIRAGRRRPHPRHGLSLARLVGVSGVVLVWAPSWERGGRIAEWPEQAVRYIHALP